MMKDNRTVNTIGSLWLCSLSLLAVSSASQAAPAAWYLWQSKMTGNYICRQWNPGEGWVRHSGPFADGGCRQAIQPPAASVRLVWAPPATRSE